MAETRTELKDRLTKAGVWEEFVDIREELKADSMDPEQARLEALRQVEPKMVATGIPAIANELSPVEGLDFSKRAPTSQALEWVSQNIANPSAKAKDAPDGMAWGLLCWTRKAPVNENNFWTTIYPRVAQKTESKPTAPIESSWDGQRPCPTCKREPIVHDPTVEALRRKIREQLGTE